jgi:hypothetical protein
MTQDELTQAMGSGQATVEEPQSSGSDAGTPAPAAQPAQPLSFEQFLPMLVAIQSTQKFLSAAPTFIPQTFQDQIQFVFDGTNYYIYVYFNNLWKSV